MSILLDFYRSTIGKKVIMALTGLILIFFVVGHMVGNLKAFGGTNTDGIHHLDEYAVYLRSIGEGMLGHEGFLWIFRSVLLVSLVLHVTCAIQLKVRNKTARPTGYQGGQKFDSATISSRTMMYGGLILLAFVIYHLLHLTFGTLHFNGFMEGKVFSNVVRAFKNPLVTGGYIVAMAALASHLYHGTWSAFQTLGLDKPSINKPLRISAKILAVVLFVGFISVPVAAFTGILHENNPPAAVAK